MWENVENHHNYASFEIFSHVTFFEIDKKKTICNELNTCFSFIPNKTYTLYHQRPQFFATFKEKTLKNFSTIIEEIRLKINIYTSIRHLFTKLSPLKEIARGLRGVIRCVVDENGQEKLNFCTYKSWCFEKISLLKANIRLDNFQNFQLIKVFAAKTIRKNQKGQSVVDEINAEIKALEICSPIARVQILKQNKQLSWWNLFHINL